jgi:hypothetical protein
VAAAPANASDCYVSSKGKICLNGFTRSDWPARAQFLGLANGFIYPVNFKIQTADGYRYYDCIGGGVIKWFDRDAVSATMVAPC